MRADPAIFKSYDIRGVYPTQINEDAVYCIARAFVHLFERSGKKPVEMKVIVGRDMRLSSPGLCLAFIDGLRSVGVSVFDAGLIAIDQMYFALGELGFTAGAMITASHNPKEYNGVKLYRGGVDMVSAEEIQELRIMSERDDGRTVDSAGTVEAVSFDDAYASKILAFADPSALKPFSVVLDAGNGMAGRVFPLVLRNLPRIKYTALYFEPDGSFPNHEPNPERLENTREIQKMVVKTKADFGAAFDGDADRITLIDDKGDALRGDVITGILAKHFLQKYGKGPIVYNVLCTRAVRDIIEKNGGTPVEWKTGHTHMKRKMREVGAIFGGELSGHLFFRDFYFAESSTLAFLLMCEIISKSGKKLSELAQELRTYAYWSRYIYLDYVPAAAIARVKETYQPRAARIDGIDGLTLHFQNPWWWFNIRPSNTETRISLTIESAHQVFTEEKKKEILALTGGRVAGDA